MILLFGIFRGKMVRDDKATWKSNYFEKMIVRIIFWRPFSCSRESLVKVAIYLRGVSDFWHMSLGTSLLL